MHCILFLVKRMCIASLAAILQGHIDMVCEKNNDVQHDFHKDALKLVKKGDWLKVLAMSPHVDCFACRVLYNLYACSSINVSL